MNVLENPRSASQGAEGPWNTQGSEKKLSPWHPQHGSHVIFLSDLHVAFSIRSPPPPPQVSVRLFNFQGMVGGRGGSVCRQPSVGTNQSALFVFFPLPARCDGLWLSHSAISRHGDRAQSTLAVPGPAHFYCWPRVALADACWWFLPPTPSAYTARILLPSPASNIRVVCWGN